MLDIQCGNINHGDSINANSNSNGGLSLLQNLWRQSAHDDRLADPLSLGCIAITNLAAHISFEEAAPNDSDYCFHSCWTAARLYGDMAWGGYNVNPRYQRHVL